MKSDAQLKMLAIAAAVKTKKDKTVTEAGNVNFDAYNAGTSAFVAVDVIGLKQNYRVLLDPKTGKIASVTPREKPKDTGRYQ